MGPGAGERGLGNHACPSFPSTLDPTSPSLLSGTRGESRISPCASTSPYPRLLVGFVSSVFGSVQGGRRNAPHPPPPLFRLLVCCMRPLTLESSSRSTRRLEPIPWPPARPEIRPSFTSRPGGGVHSRSSPHAGTEIAHEAVEAGAPKKRKKAPH